MNERFDIYEFHQLHTEAMREEAARERLAKEAPRDEGLVRKTLNAIFGSK